MSANCEKMLEAARQMNDSYFMELFAALLSGTESEDSPNE